MILASYRWGYGDGIFLPATEKRGMSTTGLLGISRVSVVKGQTRPGFMMSRPAGPPDCSVQYLFT